MRTKEDIEIEIETTLKLYYSNDNWMGYLDSLQDRDDVNKELSKIFGYKE